MFKNLIQEIFINHVELKKINLLLSSIPFITSIDKLNNKSNNNLNPNWISGLSDGDVSFFLYYI